MPKLSEALFGKSGKVKQKSLLTDTQKEFEQLISEGLKTGQGPIGDLFGFNEQNFQKGVAQPMIQQFQEEILPGIFEKFAGQGNMGSGLRRASVKGAQGLSRDIAMQRYAAQQQALQNKLSGLGTLYGRQGVENVYKPGSEGLVQGTIKGFASGLGQGIGSMGLGGLGGFGGGGGGTPNVPQASNSAVYAAMAG